MTTIQVITSVLSGLAVLLGAVATYRSSRTQQKKHDDDRYENYTTRIENRLVKVEKKLERAEQEITNLNATRRKDARWKRIAARHIEELRDYIEKHLGQARDDIPELPEELKDNLE